MIWALTIWYATCRSKGWLGHSRALFSLRKCWLILAFNFTLRDSGATFVRADMPKANSLAIGVMATRADHERAGVEE